MKKCKQVLSVLLAVVMLVAVVPVMELGITASALYENTWTNTGNQRVDIVEVAKTQLGYTEGSNNDNKYGASFNSNHQPWCAWFVSWCAAQANISDSIIHRQGVASPFSGYFNIPNHHGNKSYFPQPGDIVFYGPNSKGDHYHVGIVETVNSSTGYITTIEGNTNSNGSSEGYIVCRHSRHYQDSRICCYGSPNYISTAPNTSHNPIDAVDLCSGGYGLINIGGWAFDPDDKNAQLSIHVYIGEGDSRVGYNWIVANGGGRDDIDAVYGCGPNHGYGATIETSLTGEQKVQIFAINIGDGSNSLLGERTITIASPEERSPIGAVDYCEGRTGYVWLRGWTFDPDSLSSEINVHVYIGADSTAAGGEGHSIWAGQERSDVNDVYGCGKNHGFDVFIDTDKTGEQDVYIYAINIGEGSTRLLAKQTVTIESASPIGALDICEGGEETVHIRGWAFDPDEINQALNIHVYIGADSTAAGGEGHSDIYANQERADVNDIYGCGSNHGYDVRIKTSKTGNQTVYVYAINTGRGGNCLIGSKTVNISPHTHSYTSSITQTATCIAAGVETFTCSCGDSYTKPIAINPNNHVNTTNVAATASTCTVKGYSAGVYCNDCKQYISGHVEQSLAAHQTTVINAREATYDADGYTGDTYCTVCKQTLSYGSSIPKLTKPEEPTNPTNPTQPATQPATQQQQQQSGNCKYCGGTHSGFPGILIGFFHSILAMFGLRK